MPKTVLSKWMMEEEEGNGEATPPLEPRRHELLAAAVGEDKTPARQSPLTWTSRAGVNFFFNHHAPLQMVAPAAAAINLLTPQSIMGLSLVSAAGTEVQSAVNKAGVGEPRGGRNAELQSKGRHSDNVFHNTRAHTFCLIHIHTYMEHTHFSWNTDAYEYKYTYFLIYTHVWNTHTYANVRTLVLSYTNLYLKYTPLFSK